MKKAIAKSAAAKLQTNQDDESTLEEKRISMYKRYIEGAEFLEEMLNNEV